MDKTSNAVVNVVSVEGDVVVLNAAGEMRAAQINDQLQPGEKVITSENSEAVINLGDRTVEQLPSDSVALVVIDPETGEVYLNIQTLLEQSQDEESELSEIEQLILAGADPTELLEETAAGGEAGATAPANDGFTGLGEVLRTGDEVIAEAGFDTGTDGDTRDGDDDQQQGLTELVVPVPTVQAITNPEVTEGDTLVYNVTLSNAGAVATTFALGLGGGSASADDYTALSFSNGVVNNGDGTITVPAGVATFTASLPTVDDPNVENTETAPLVIGGVNGTGSILDNDVLTVADVTDASNEEGNTLVHTVTLSGSSVNAETFDFSLAGDTATSGADFNSTPTFSNGVTYDAGTGKITVPANVTNFTVTVVTVDDALYEPSETYDITVGGQVAVGTITDNEPAPILTINNLDVSEGADAVFDVNLSTAIGGATRVFFTADTAGGNTAESGDISSISSVTYQGTTGTVIIPQNGDGSFTIPEGVTSLKVSVPTTQDDVYEGPETFTLSATVDNSGVDTTDTGTATIHDDGTNGSVDDRPGISVNDLDVAEGNTANFAVSLDEAADADVVVNLGLANGSAETDDYSQTMTVTYVDGGGVTQTLAVDGSGNVTVPAGITALNVAVATTDDAGNPVYEGPETFTLTAATSTDTDTGTATIHDDGTNGSVDDRPGISVNDLDVAEGNTANFAVTLDEAAEADVVVNLGLANGSAETDDYSQTMTVTYVDGGGVTQTLAVDVQRQRHRSGGHHCAERGGGDHRRCRQSGL